MVVTDVYKCFELDLMSKKERQIAFRRTDIRDYKFAKVKELPAFKYLKNDSKVFDKLLDVALAKSELFEDDFLGQPDLFALIKTLKEQQLETDNLLAKLLQNIDERLNNLERKIDSLVEKKGDFFHDEEPLVNQYAPKRRAKEDNGEI